MLCSVCSAKWTAPYKRSFNEGIMAKRMLCIASSFAATAVVYKANTYVQRQTDERSSCSRCNERKEKIQSAIEQTRKQIIRLKNEVGAPGIVVGVSVDGNVLWKEGIGFSDLENEVPAHEDTVMRIASISKSLTAAVVGRLWQEGKIDIDQPIQKYVPSFPEKTFGDEKVTITTRQLMCHLAGIRHYSKLKKDDAVGAGDGQLEEFYGKERYETTEKALSIFKNDDLLHLPGSKYLYTTYGWTVVSAVMEGATGKTYPQLIRAFLRDIGMRRTYLDEPEPIIYGRSKCYGKNKNGRIINSPYVDNSCKWAGGGILSTVGDLLKFANAMLYAFQFGSTIDISKAKQVVGVVKGKTNHKLRIFKQKVVDEKKISEDENKRVTENKVSSTSRIESDRKISDASEGIDKAKQVDTIVKSDETNLDRVMKAGRIAGTAAKYVGKGVAYVGSYVWDKTWSMIGKEDEGKEGDSEKESRVSNVDRMKDIGSQAGTAAKYVGKGVADAGSYVWDKTWSMIGKEDEGKEGDSEKESRVSNVDRMKDIGSQAGTAAKYVGKGVADAGSYVWDSIWPKSGNQTEKEDKSVEKQSAYSVIKESLHSAVGNLQKRATSGDEENKDKDVNNDEQENKSWGVYFKNIFRPKALDSFNDQDFRAKFHSNKTISSDEIPPRQELIYQGILLKKIIPYAVNVVLGIQDKDICDAEIIEDHSESLSRDKDIELPCLSCNFHFQVPEKNYIKPVNRPYISQKTIASLWTMVENSKVSDWGPNVEGGYGLGFGVAHAVDCPGGVDDGGQSFMIGHTGGAVGASSALIVMPRDCESSDPPKGVAVVILTNLQSVSLNPLAIEIARMFANATH